MVGALSNWSDDGTSRLIARLERLDSNDYGPSRNSRRVSLAFFNDVHRLTLVRRSGKVLWLLAVCNSAQRDHLARTRLAPDFRFSTSTGSDRSRAGQGRRSGGDQDPCGGEAARKAQDRKRARRSCSGAFPLDRRRLDVYWRLLYVALLLSTERLADTFG